jgi:enoyl-[acyl-carrier protein] reductase II
MSSHDARPEDEETGGAPAPIRRLRGARPRFDTKVTRLFGVDLPIVQGAMAWLSEAELAAAVSNEGGLGVLGASIMPVDAFEAQVVRAKALTDRPFAVNFPLVLGDYSEHLEMALGHGVGIVFMSAGSPKKLTPRIKAAGAQCVHVVPNLRLAERAVAAGVDAVVLESYEAGGHVSSDGVTAITNIPNVARALDAPVIAAGGIADGFGMAAAMTLGADGVQMGTRFLATEESNAPEVYQRLLLDAEEGDAKVYSSAYHPGRALSSPVVERLLEMERAGAPMEEIRAYLGRGRAKKAAHESDLEEGMFYAGAGAALVKDVLPVGVLLDRILDEYRQAVVRAAGLMAPVEEGAEPPRAADA